MNKKNIILISLLVLFCIGYVVLFYFLSGNQNNSEGYIVVSELGGYYCKAKNCAYKNVEDMNLDGKNIEVYQQNESLGTYQLDYVERWNFTENDSWKPIYGDFLGIDTSLNAQIFPFQYEKLNESDYEQIQKLLKGVTYQTLNQDYAYVYDIDQNGVMDRIVAVSNQTEEEKNEQFFSLFYLVLNGKVIEVYKEFSEEEYTLPFYHLFSLFRLDEEKNVRMIVNKNYYDQMGSPSMIMYQINKNSVKVIVKDSLENTK